MRQAVLPLLLAVELAVFAQPSGVHFGTWREFLETTGEYGRNLLIQATPLLVLVPGMTIVMMTAGIDLSVGSMVALVAGVMATFEPSGSFWLTAVPLGVVLAVALGGFNGLLIARLDVPPIIATLGTLIFYRGLCQAVLGSREPAPFVDVPGYEWWGTWAGSIILAATVVISGGAYFHFSRWRREILMIGGNRIAARYAGIPVSWRLVQVYALMGLLCFPAALSVTAHDGAVTASSLEGYELQVIVAVVLGGTRVSGGFGSIVGSVYGVLLVAVMQEGLRNANKLEWLARTLPFKVDSSLNNVLLGALLIAGVWLNTHVPAARRQG